MKRFLLVCGLLLLIVPVAAAATYNSTAGWSQPLDVTFTTTAVGAVSAHATFPSLKGNARPSLTLRHLTDPSDKMSYDAVCQAYQNQSGQWVVTGGDLSGSGAVLGGSAAPGDLSCSFSGAPSGLWLAEFLTTSGKTQVSLTVSP